MSDLTKRLRDHVNKRGGPCIKGGAWDMMMQAADEIDSLSEQVLAWKASAEIKQNEINECRILFGKAGFPSTFPLRSLVSVACEQLREREQSNA